MLGALTSNEGIDVEASRRAVSKRCRSLVDVLLLDPEEAVRSPASPPCCAEFRFELMAQ